MSEVQSRPSATRGRGSGRGGRGGVSSTRGGGRIAGRNGAPNGDAKHDTTDSSLPTPEDEGEVGQLKKVYGSKVEVIKEIVPDWSEVDILFALRETDGDENLAVTRIAEGTIAQWGEVSKPKKDRVRAKGKPDGFPTTNTDAAGARPARGGRPIDSGRGRGRATDRGGRGGARGKPAGASNGTRAKETPQLSVPTEEAHDWGNNHTDDWDTPAAAPAEVAPIAPKAAPAPASAIKTWASMLRQSTAPKAAPKPKEAPAAEPAEPTVESPAAETEHVDADPELTPAPAPVEEEVIPEPVEETPAPVVEEAPTVVVPEIALPPSKDQLTETNLEQIADSSGPAPEGTARSEATDSWDPRAQNPSATATPLSASQQQHQPLRAPTSGFAATATKATERAANRTPSHTRRILEQREAVRMPGNRGEVDHAAVQFGAFSLNGPVDDDVDGDREEPETRQPPEESPVAHIRTALPTVAPAQITEGFPTQKPAASPLPPTGPAAAASLPQTAPTAPSQAVQPPTAPSAQQQYGGRFGQPAPQEPSSFPSQKPFESFGQPQASSTAAQSQFDGGFPSQAQPGLPPTQQPVGAFSSAPSDYSAYYTAEGRTAPYNQYFSNNQTYGQQQGAQGQQDSLSAQTGRSFSGYNAGQNDPLSQYPQSGGQHQSRFGAAATAAEAPSVANPAPTQTASQAPGQTAQSQTHGQQQHEYPYSHPYNYSPFYSGYMGNQGGYNYNSYGPYGGKGGHGYQPNQYGPQQGLHAYGSSPAAGFSQTALHRDSPAAAAGLNDYGRTGTTQAGQQQGLVGGGFGGMHDAFGRGAASSFQAGQGFNAPGTQPGSGPSAGDDLKPFGDGKATGGPSPSLGAAARPGSAVNNGPSQTGLPPPQSAQQGGLSGYGGYPNHVQGHGLHGNQASGGYGMNASGAQGHQNTGYGGGYGNQGFGSYYGNPPRGGGWANNFH